jgi:hypothetical protein
MDILDFQGQVLHFVGDETFKHSIAPKPTEQKEVDDAKIST